MGEYAGLMGRRVCVTGGAGFLGRAVCRRLEAAGASPPFVPRSRDFDLTRREEVVRLFDEAQPDIVIHLAAEVGGIGANQRHPGRFFYANMAMGLHLIEEGRAREVERFVQVGSVCAYPKHCPVPFQESALWGGFPEETNAPYGVAKRSLGLMLQAYRAEYGLNGAYVIPVNLYGPADNFDYESSHVIPALIRKFDEAARAGAGVVRCWGTGKASREFLYVEDAAEGVVRAAAALNDPEPINLGTGEEIRIAVLAEKIARLCGFTGRIEWDLSHPDGQPRRCLDTRRAWERLGWRACTSLESGLASTVVWWQGVGRFRGGAASDKGKESAAGGAAVQTG